MTLQWWLQGFYLFTMIFGISVTVVDMLGILGVEDDHGAGDHRDHGAAVHGDAQDGAEELLFECAHVIVAISRQAMGKVRVKLGQSVVERYALAEDEGDAFRTGDVVEIVRVGDDCVYVCRAAGKLSLDESW